jgi:hypothetical protein
MATQEYHEILGGYTDPIVDDVSATHRGAIEVMPRTVGEKYVKNRNAGTKRDKLAQAQLKAGIAGLWRDGRSYQEIADRINDQYGLNITKDGVKYHITTQLEYWRKLSMTRIDERQAMLLARLDQIEQLAITAYFASMGDKEIKVYEEQIERARQQSNKDELQKRVRKERDDIRRAKHKGEQVEMPFQEDGELPDSLIVMSEKIKDYLRTESNPAGDPRFLQIMLEVNKHRAQLWGIWNRKEEDSNDMTLTKLTDEDRYKRLGAILATVAQRRTKDVGALAPAAPLGGFEDGKEPKDAGHVLEGIDSFLEGADPDIEEIEDDEEWD